MVPSARQTCWPATRRFVNEAFVPQTLEEKRLVDETAPVISEVIKPFVAVAFVRKPFVAKRFVVVTLVAVAFVVTRPAIEPVAAEIPPETFTLEAFTLAKLAVPLTLILEDVTPPKNVTATEVVAPRAVTMASVSVEYIETQFVPLARQTC